MHVHRRLRDDGLPPGAPIEALGFDGKTERALLLAGFATVEKLEAAPFGGLRALLDALDGEDNALERLLARIDAYRSGEMHAEWLEAYVDGRWQR